MKTPICIEARLTHRYVGSCAHLDSWATVCNARATAPYTVNTPDGSEASDGLTRAFVISLSSDQLARARKSHRQLRALGHRGQSKVSSSFSNWLRRAIEDHYSSHGCHHEHDCCGCASTYADAHQTKRREFAVVVRTSYNY